MAFPQQFLDDVQIGKSFLTNLDAEDTENLERGCASCSVKNYNCLAMIISNLEFKIDLDQYDDIAIKEYEKMLIIIGDYTIQVPPTVDAGANQSVPISDSAYFSATIVPGSAAITNIQWSIVSGTGVLTNANTANVIVDGFSIGGNVLKIVVTDANGRTASDTVILTGTAATDRVYYLFSDTNDLPTEEEILEADFINVVPGSASYTVPVNNGEVQYVMIAELLTEPNKTRWDDVVDPDNNGVIGINKTILPRVTVGSYGVYVTNFKTEFPNPITLS